MSDRGGREQRPVRRRAAARWQARAVAGAGVASGVGRMSSAGLVVHHARANRQTIADTAGMLRQMRLLLERLEREQVGEYVNMMHSPWRMMSLNMLSGIFRGLGIALGFTIFTTFVVWFLNWLGALNLPIVGDYLADLVRAVQEQLENRRF